MTREDIQLLLADLCGRLPYGVKVQYNGSSIRLMQAIDIDGNGQYFKSKEVAGWLDIESCKPYLRPMSSMSGEEYNELADLLKAEDPDLKLNEVMATIEIDFFNKKMFDYRGLIPKGLANVAPEDMYNFV